ncbi:MAG: hypothetical protein JWO03_3305 [Bacteroidetes bacterium]|nr:hypothetical protein [Bacteroidota bacterium]
MNKLLPTLILSLCCSALVHAQSASPQVIASGGAYISSASGSISYTVGEAVTPTLAGGGHILTQGFQQPNDILIGLLDIEKEASGSFSVYPVPATDKLWFGYEFPAGGQVKVDLYNTLGQKLDFTLSEAYESGKVVHSFDCTPYAAGQYVLSVTITAADNSLKTLSKQFLIIN